MAAALGDEDYTSAADEERDSDARRRDRESNNKQQSTEGHDGGGARLLHGRVREAQCGYCEPCAFLVACRVVSCRKRWYAEMGAFQSSKIESDNQPVRSCDSDAFLCRLGALNCSRCHKNALGRCKYDDFMLEISSITCSL